VPVRDKTNRVEEKEQEIAALNLGTIIYLSLVFSPPKWYGAPDVHVGTVLKFFLILFRSVR